MLILSAGMILLVIGWLGAWSNHFESSFHFDDIPTIVTNPSIQHLSSIPRFFTNARISSAEKETVSYRPLLSSWFAVDYRLGSGAKAFVFQSENFIWFGVVLVTMFALFRLIPGVEDFAAAFATLLFGLHPVMADTVNYALQRGVLMGAFGVTAGLLLWVVWPWLLPQAIPLKLKRVPEHGFDEYLRENLPRLNAKYFKFIHAPLGVYLWPVVPALLAEPGTSAFAPILVVYVLLFETRRKLRDVIPAAVLCAGYWIFQLWMTWKAGAFSLVTAPNYWFTQPWVAIRYLLKFFAPVNLSVDSDFTAFQHPWDPLAIAGYAGLAALAGVALATGRRPKWRAVSFGLWWFLLALLPEALTPHRAVEANWRMFLPFAGLALSSAALLSIGFQSLRETIRVPVSIGAGVAGLGLLALCGWATFQRTAVWESEATLWRDAINVSPHNGRVLMNYGLTRLAVFDPTGALDYMRRASVAAPGDPIIETSLARTYDGFSRAQEAEDQFRRAGKDGPAWSPAFSAYGEFLLSHNRTDAAFDAASKAVALDPYDMVGRRTLMDVFAQRHQWKSLKEFAEATLRLYPEDPDGSRALIVAQTGLDQVGKAETDAKARPSVDNYLALSVMYFNAQRYEDCIAAARQALKINPDQAEAYANIASAYHTMGKLDETIAALREEVRLNPDLRSARSNLLHELAAKEQSGK